MTNLKVNSRESFLPAEFEIAAHKKVQDSASFLANRVEFAGATAENFAAQTATQPRVS